VFLPGEGGRDESVGLGNHCGDVAFGVRERITWNVDREQRGEARMLKVYGKAQFHGRDGEFTASSRRCEVPDRRGTAAGVAPEAMTLHDVESQTGCVLFGAPTRKRSDAGSS
jgi:hypothetical protein